MVHYLQSSYSKMATVPESKQKKRYGLHRVKGKKTIKYTYSLNCSVCISDLYRHFFLHISTLHLMGVRFPGTYACLEYFCFKCSKITISSYII